jgi:predicted Zn-dependent protease
MSAADATEVAAITAGAEAAINAGYDPQGMLEVLRVLQEAMQNAAPPEFLSTHPHPDTRIRTVTRLLERDYAHTQDNPDYQLHRQRFQQQLAPHLRADIGRPSSPAALAIMSLARGCTCCGGK